jgi:hypothetical protein
VGRRLAYDAAKGRLWVVCTACGRWNLTPLEQRWEAIEDAERLFRKARLRAATDNVGLARVADGADLVRVGRPAAPELATWRYCRHLRAGDTVARARARRRRDDRGRRDGGLRSGGRSRSAESSWRRRSG